MQDALVTEEHSSEASLEPRAAYCRPHRIDVGLYLVIASRIVVCFDVKESHEHSWNLALVFGEP